VRRAFLAAQRPAPSAVTSAVHLIELVISIVIIAISVKRGDGRADDAFDGLSAEAMVRNQAVAIANRYLERSAPERLAAKVCRFACTVRHISDYNGLTDVGARDQFGTAIAGLEQYTVTVSVGAGSLGAVPGASVRRIDVNVQHPAASTYVERI